MKKYVRYILILIVLVGMFSPTTRVEAETCTAPNTPPGCTPVNTTYHLLAPLPCVGTDCPQNDEINTTNGVAGYLNMMIRIFIGLCAVLAVVMIVVGGIEYMTSELVSSKEAGKERIRGAIVGLLLALGAYALLYTINPDLLESDLDSLTQATIITVTDRQMKQYSGQGKCTPIQSGWCSPAALTAAGFQNGIEASSICNGESTGLPNLASGVDMCKDNNSFSFGLFQVNIIAHANEIPGGICSGIFEVSGGGTQGACLQSEGGICKKRDCRVKDPIKFQSCVNFITNPTNNITYAKNLQAARGWGQWGANNSCRF